MKRIISTIFLSIFIAIAFGQTNDTMSNTIKKSEQEWAKKLSTEEYKVLRQCGTEAPFSGKYVNHKEDGYYHCAGCGAKLFSSDTKYDSGSGWPSFYAAVDTTKVVEIVDKSLGMIRTEIKCANCGGHLGHVFNDGPKPTGLRFCVNSASLDFNE